jgi:DNA-binding MarR family transcriptional regulator
MSRLSSDSQSIATPTIAVALAQLCGAFRSHLDAALREHGLYVGQEHALMHLWDEDGLTQTQLVERMGCTPATISNMVVRMESSGLVQRKRSAEDARITQVFLSQEGRALETSVRALWKRAEDEMLAGFTTEERVLLRRLLLQARDNLKG